MCLLLPQGGRGPCLSRTIVEGTRPQRGSSFKHRSFLEKARQVFVLEGGARQVRSVSRWGQCGDSRQRPLRRGGGPSAEQPHSSAREIGGSRFLHETQTRWPRGENAREQAEAFKGGR